MSHEIKILELPLWQIEYVLKLMRFSTENPSLKRNQIEALRQIENLIVAQIDPVLK